MQHPPIKQQPTNTLNKSDITPPKMDIMKALLEQQNQQQQSMINLNMINALLQQQQVQQPIFQQQQQLKEAPSMMDNEVLQYYLRQQQHRDNVVAGLAHQKPPGIMDRSVPVSYTLKPEPVFTECPPAHQRIKGKVYLVRGTVKRWDGKRFARCCEVRSCTKLAQGPTSFCKSHGGGTRCKADGCQKAARGGFVYCALHGGGGKRSRDEMSNPDSEAEDVKSETDAQEPSDANPQLELETENKEQDRPKKLPKRTETDTNMATKPTNLVISPSNSPNLATPSMNSNNAWCDIMKKSIKSDVETKAQTIKEEETNVAM
eukprot:CAMPEP_0203748652 /NCGR_PEP_ID=MMETSP0098-20131031/3479_1 /ASSEMBLY_ACC=CAM_ASM_000208 /TAXON_ID=96639 /ORGANISM=" , Strain NY0313808BC1" /LENGTH=316 /DNA_ID=CAMNT_0050637473 /DNA_START=290 /DNA_END=1240 /DNA_ORIENTATION=-